MNRKSIVLLSAVVLVLYMGMCTLVQHSWNSGCTWFVAEDTPVYTPGTADEIAVTLPAGTNCRVDESVGDTWKSIEYMLGGRTCTGMVLADSLSRR